MSVRADLHCHSTFSDGTLTPSELILLAKEVGLVGLCITDHDTLSAYPEVLSVASKEDIDLISGAEFSTTFQNRSIHILAYSVNLNEPYLNAFCQKHKQRRAERNRAILDLLAQQGIPISEEEMIAMSAKDSRLAKRSIGRPHIAVAMIQKGYVQTIEEAFSRYLGDGMLCYQRGPVITVEETLDVIHRSNGFAVIAHPHLIRERAIVRQLLEMPFDGIECYYAKYSLEQNRPWIEIAKKKGLLATGGSDYHGANKPLISLGCAWAPEETFRILQERYKENNPLA